MARTKNNNTERHKNTHNIMTQHTFRRNYIFVFSDFFIFFFIYNFLNEFSKKYWVTALVRSMTFIESLNQF